MRITGNIVLSRLSHLQLFINDTPLCEPIEILDSDRLEGSVELEIEWTSELTIERKVKRSPWNKIKLEDPNNSAWVTLDASIDPLEVERTKFSIYTESTTTITESHLIVQNFYSDHEAEEFTYQGSSGSSTHPHLDNRTVSSLNDFQKITVSYEPYQLLETKNLETNSYIHNSQETSYYSAIFPRPIVDLKHCQILYDSNYGMALLDLIGAKLYYNVPFNIDGSIIYEVEDFPLMLTNPESYKYYTFYDARIAYNPTTYKVWIKEADSDNYIQLFPDEKFIIPSYFDMVHCFFCVTTGDTKIVDLYQGVYDKLDWIPDYEYFNSNVSKFYSLRKLDLFAGEDVKTQRKLHANLYISLQLFKKLRVDYPQDSLRILDCGIQVGSKYFVPYTEYYDSDSSRLRVLPAGVEIDNMVMFKSTSSQFIVTSLINMIDEKIYPSLSGTSYLISRGNLFRSTPTSGVANVNPRS